MLHKSVWSRTGDRDLYIRHWDSRRCYRKSSGHVRSRWQETACLPRDRARKQSLPISWVSRPVSTKYSRRSDGVADPRAPRDIRTNMWVVVAASCHDHIDDPILDQCNWISVTNLFLAKAGVELPGCAVSMTGRCRTASLCTAWIAITTLICAKRGSTRD